MRIWKNTSTLNGFDDGLTFTESKSKADIILLGSKPIEINQFPNLKGIFRAGVGRDNVPEKEAEKKDIIVKYPSDKTIKIIFNETASFTCSLIFRMLYKNLGTLDPWIKEPRRQLSKKILLVIGVGKIGSQVAQLMKQFLNVKTFDILHNEQSELKPLMQQADCVSIHIPNINDICEKKIIFIVGMPRCGSTLLSKIINYNNKFKDISENFNINNIIGTVKENMLDYKDKVKTFVDKTYDDNIIDKTLTNFEFIGVIRQVFPNAKIIHLKRNKMHHLWSNFTHIYSNGLKYTYDWEMMNDYHNYYIKYMEHWNKKYDDILNIQFEDILSDSDTVLKEIFEYIEEDFNEDCYDFYKKTDENNTVSNFQVKEPLQTNKVDKFEHYKELFEADDEIRKIFFK